MVRVRVRVKVTVRVRVTVRVSVAGLLTLISWSNQFVLFAVGRCTWYNKFSKF